MIESLRKIIARITGEEYTPPPCPRCAQNKADVAYWRRIAESKHLTTYPTVMAHEVLLVDHVAFRHDGRVIDGEVIEIYVNQENQVVLVLKPGFHFTDTWKSETHRPNGTRIRSQSSITTHFALDQNEPCKLIMRFS